MCLKLIKRVFYKNEPDFSANELGSTNLIGSSLIRSLLKKLPSAPGVYRMLGGSGDVLYVGKARNLKKRVSSYARRQLDSRRIGLMVSQTVAMEFVITRSEVEALLLEANLIKRFSPRYNILMRDDKSFPCILVTSNHPWPGVFRRRGKVSERGERFGPFASSQSVTQTINTLQRAFLIRTCTDSFFKNRSRPCLLYQIRRCSAPCTGEISMAEYAQLVREAKDFLSGRNQKIKKEISSRMQEASEKLDFEKAAVYRDRLAALSHVQSYQGVDLHGLQDIDVFSIHHDGERSCVQVFFFRGGQNRGGRACFPNADPSIEPEVILASFLAQFYNEERPPPTILSSIRIKEQELLARALSLQAGYSVTIFVPGRGAEKGYSGSCSSECSRSFNS